MRVLLTPVTHFRNESRQKVEFSLTLKHIVFRPGITKTVKFMLFILGKCSVRLMLKQVLRTVITVR